MGPLNLWLIGSFLQPFRSESEEIEEWQENLDDVVTTLHGAGGIGARTITETVIGEKQTNFKKLRFSTEKDTSAQ